MDYLDELDRMDDPFADGDYMPAPKPRKKTASKKTPPAKRVKRRFTPRPHQAIAKQKFDDGLRRQVLIWHRRAGKDIFALNLAAAEMEKQVGTYWHLYPTHVQAKRAIWNGISNTGERFLEQAFPSSRRVATRSQDLQIEMDNGAMWQLCGSDRFDSLVGSNPLGVVFDEWALCDPRAWDYIRPIIRENGGWVVFITTYRNRNHAFRMAERLKDNPEWFVDIRTVEDTTDNNGNRLITDADIQAERDEGMSEALIQQEYYCNPIAAQAGAIYGRSFEQLMSSGRVGSFAYDASRPVLASWSLEFADQYTVVFHQVVGNESRVIGSKSFPFHALSECIQRVNHEFPWRYISRHIVPPKTPNEMIEQFENHSAVTELAPDLSSPFSVTRDQLNLTWIDTAPRAWEGDDGNNEQLVDALNGYRFAKASAGQSYTNTPVNSWEKHFARALEVFATWRNAEPNELGSWYPRASTEQQDRAVI